MWDRLEFGDDFRGRPDQRAARERGTDYSAATRLYFAAAMSSQL